MKIQKTDKQSFGRTNIYKAGMTAVEIKTIGKIAEDIKSSIGSAHLNISKQQVVSQRNLSYYTFITNPLRSGAFPATKLGNLLANIWTHGGTDIEKQARMKITFNNPKTFIQKTLSILKLEPKGKAYSNSSDNEESLGKRILEAVEDAKKDYFNKPRIIKRKQRESLKVSEHLEEQALNEELKNLSNLGLKIK